MAQYSRIDGIPNIVLIGVPDQSALTRVIRKLESHSIRHCVWKEPDFDLGLTAVATVPLDRVEKEALRNYRLWSPLYGCSSEKEQPILNREVGGSSPSSRAMFAGSSAARAPWSFGAGEVGGSNPSR